MITDGGISFADVLADATAWLVAGPLVAVGVAFAVGLVVLIIGAYLSIRDLR